MSDRYLNDKRESRPSMANELRAWISVGVLLLVNIIGGVWWAATLSTELRQVREGLAELKVQMSDRYSGSDAARDNSATRARIEDHENRIRDLERARGKP